MSRANDLGSELPGDATDSAPVNPITGRAPIDYAIPRPFETTKFSLSVIDEGSDQELEIDIRSTTIKDSLTNLQSILSDVLAVAANDGEDARLGLSILGWVIGSVLQEDGTYVTTVARHEFDYDSANEKWRPVNTFQCIVKSEGNDTLICRTYNDGVEGDTDIIVYKPFELRRTPYDGQTIEGVTYAYTGPNIRNATGLVDGVEVTFTEEIVRKYTADFTRILVTKVAGLDGYVDLNNGARAWAKTGEVV